MIKSVRPASDVFKQATANADAAVGKMSITVPDFTKARLGKIEIPKLVVADPAMLAQIAEVQKHFKQLTAWKPAWLDEFRESQRRLGDTLKQVGAGMREAMEAYKPIFAEIARTGDECKRIEAAGWLPHYTTPFAKLTACGDDVDAVGSAISKHYSEEWPSVEANFLDHLSTYDIGEEAKATVRQVLTAHGHGLYRLTARSLFPEIERVVRDEIHKGSLKPITSQSELKELAGRLGLQDTQPGGMYAMSLFRKFLKHLYDHANTVEQLEALAVDSVPNRHACLHGLLSYASQQNSVNALVMTDFVFQIVCALKRRAEGSS